MPDLLTFWSRALLAIGLVLWVAAMAGAALILLSHRLYFLTLPRRAIARYKGTEPERLRLYLERVAATPSLVGPGHKLTVRGELTAIYLTSGRHAEAAAHCRASIDALRSRRLAGKYPALEADIRRRLADCLDALGRGEEAAGERRIAEALVEEAPDDPLRHLTRGTLLEREHRFAEACEAFERAVEAAPESSPAIRVECLVHLVLASFNAGRPADCLRAAEEAIALGATGRHLRVAHRMAGIASGNLGRLDDSEAHCRRAHEVALDGGGDDEVGQALGGLADLLRKRGKLAEAEEAARQAADYGPAALRMSLAIRAHVHRERGDFDRALEALDRYAETPPLVIPAAERRTQGALVLDRSRIEAEAGRGDAAWVHVQQALATFGDDAKLGLKCDAAASWVFAARGLADDSRRVADQAEAGLPEFADDPSTLRSVAYDLAWAAGTRGDHDDGERWWTEYLALSPDPVYRPTAFCRRGDCRRGRGDEPGAIADYREAIALGIDSYHARLARRRLSEASPA